MAFAPAAPAQAFPLLCGPGLGDGTGPPESPCAYGPVEALAVARFRDRPRTAESGSGAVLQRSPAGLIRPHSALGEERSASSVEAAGRRVGPGSQMAVAWEFSRVCARRSRA
ncbi:hypothetical protein GCM10022630_39860 [Thermobifida alba]